MIFKLVVTPSTYDYQHNVLNAEITVRMNNGHAYSLGLVLDPRMHLESRSLFKLIWDESGKRLEEALVKGDVVKWVEELDI